MDRTPEPKDLRRRESYKRWKRLIEFFEKKLNERELEPKEPWKFMDIASFIEDTLKQIHAEFNDMSAYGSQRKADWSLESLEFAIEEYREELYLDRNEDQIRLY